MPRHTGGAFFFSPAPAFSLDIQPDLWLTEVPQTNTGVFVAFTACPSRGEKNELFLCFAILRPFSGAENIWQVTSGNPRGPAAVLGRGASPVFLF